VGHIRVGRLPKTKRWGQVLELLADQPDAIDRLVEATATAAKRRLDELQSDPALGYTVWLLARIADAAQGRDFAAALRATGLTVDGDESAAAFIGKVGDHLREQYARLPESGTAAELALLSARRALTETVGTQTGSLFGGSLADLQAAMMPAAGPAGFGLLARRFFGDLLSRTLGSFVEREVANHTGQGYGLASAADARSFKQELDRYCRESARILESFAPEWFSVNRFRSAGEVPQERARGFTVAAMRKLRSELEPAYR
jgi:hypothetical protein